MHAVKLRSPRKRSLDRDFEFDRTVRSRCVFFFFYFDFTLLYLHISGEIIDVEIQFIERERLPNKLRSYECLS